MLGSLTTADKVTLKSPHCPIPHLVVLKHSLPRPKLGRPPHENAKNFALRTKKGAPHHNDLHTIANSNANPFLRYMSNPVTHGTRGWAGHLSALHCHHRRLPPSLCAFARIPRRHQCLQYPFPPPFPTLLSCAPFALLFPRLPPTSPSLPIPPPLFSAHLFRYPSTRTQAL